MEIRGTLRGKYCVWRSCVFIFYAKGEKSILVAWNKNEKYIHIEVEWLTTINNLCPDIRISTRYSSYREKFPCLFSWRFLKLDLFYFSKARGAYGVF